MAILKISGNLNLANAPLLEGLVLDALAKGIIFFEKRFFNNYLKKSFKTFSEYGEYESDQPPIIVIDLSCVAHLGKK